MEAPKNFISEQETDNFSDEEIARTVTSNIYEEVRDTVARYGSFKERPTESGFELATDTVEIEGPVYMVEADIWSAGNLQTVMLWTSHEAQGQKKTFLFLKITPDKVRLNILGGCDRELETLHELGKAYEFVTAATEQMESSYSEDSSRHESQKNGLSSL